VQRGGARFAEEPPASDPELCCGHLLSAVVHVGEGYPGNQRKRKRRFPPKQLCSRAMPDDNDGSADELILKLQHLEAQARESEKARHGEGRAASLKSRAQQMAAAAQVEVTGAENDQRQGEEKVARARQPGQSPLAAADLLVSGRDQAQDAKTRLVKSRARLNFALEQMDEAERLEWDALQASARAETHGQLADDPLLNRMPAPDPAPSSSPVQQGESSSKADAGGAPDPAGAAPAPGAAQKP